MAVLFVQKQFWSLKDFDGNRHPELSEDDESKNDEEDDDELEDLDAEDSDSELDVSLRNQTTNQESAKKRCFPF
jgi:hypothetical protein